MAFRLSYLGLKPTFFITGTDTGAGKTVLTALLAEFLRARGVRVAAFKPLCSGGRADAEKIHAALGGALTLDEINPWHFRAALAPALAARLEKKSVTLAQIRAHIRARRKDCDVTLVEGAGGLLSPLGNCSGGLRRSPKTSALTERRYKKSFDSHDLILALRATPIIVAQNKLGAVNHLLLTLAALPENFRAAAKVVLMSPAKPDAATATNARLLAEFFPAENIFTLPWFGKKFSRATALKKPRVRRTLQKLFDRETR
jgi:dethiobiotin synthetase